MSLLVCVLFAETCLVGRTDKACAIDYAPGEEMVFSVALTNARPFAADGFRFLWTREGDDGKKETGEQPFSPTAPLVVRTSLDRPGFVKLTARLVDAKGNKIASFNGGAGVELEKLQSVDEPADFDDFWERRKARLANVPLAAELKEHPSSDLAVRVYSFSVACAGPRPVTGTLTVPAKPGKFPAEITFQAFSEDYVQKPPKGGPHDRLLMHINAHGYELGREAEYYKEFYASIRSGEFPFAHDRKQNESVDTAYFSGMTYRVMRALQYLKSRPEWDGAHLTARGTSMGGMQAIWAASLDGDVTSVKAEVPWCCDVGGRGTLGRLVDGYCPKETKALRYFDPVNLARRIGPTCRVEIVRAGLGDYCCPPSGLAILYNNLPCAASIRWVQGSTHGYVPPADVGNQAFTLFKNQQDKKEK